MLMLTLWILFFLSGWLTWTIYDDFRLYGKPMFTLVGWEFAVAVWVITVIVAMQAFTG